MLEPATTLTDYFLAGECLVMGILLWRNASTRDRLPMLWWGVGFIFLGLAALLGGTMHGFVSPLQPHLKNFIWRAIMACIGLYNAFLVSGMFGAVLSHGVASAVILNSGVAGTYVLLIFAAYSLNVVILHYVLSMSALLLCCAGLPSRDGKDYIFYPLAGFLLSGVAVAVWQTGWGVNAGPWFNHNVRCHVIQMVAMIPLYIAGRNLRLNPGTR